MRKFLIVSLIAATGLPALAENYGIQVGAFQEFDRAENVQEALEDAGYNSYFSEADGYKRVRVGPFATRQEAELEARSLWPFLVARFGPLEFEKSWVVVEDRAIENAPLQILPSSPRVFGDGVPSDPVGGRASDGSPDDSATELIEAALIERGVPYRWGGMSSDGFDCSGFTQHMFARSGFAIPRQAKNQFKVGEAIGDKDLLPGDLVFFSTYTRGASHVGIYMGNGDFIHASSGEGCVTVTPLAKRYYANRFLGARRILSVEPEILKTMTELVNR